jgi:hypothetical protein
MPDIISAKCLGCGNVIKVPAALGGKKARCPQCTNTIVIPTSPSDTQFTEFISDDDLPEVARDVDLVKPEEGDAPIPGQEQEEAAEGPTEARRRGGTSVRGRIAGGPAPQSRANPRSGTQPRYAPGGTATRKKPEAPAGNSTPMIIGIAVAVLVLVLAAVYLSKGKENGHSTKGGAAPKQKERDKEPDKSKIKGPQYSEAEQALISRLMAYTGTVDRGDLDGILRFYAYEPEDERKMRIRVAEDLVNKKVSYENVQVKSINASGGTITFSHSGGEKTLTWKQVNDVWLIAEMPSP